MRKLLTFVFLFFLIVIHTIDLELTTYYIYNDAEKEGFLPMSWAIAFFGIHSACWLSRLVMYSYFFLALVNHKRDRWFYFLILVTTLYWTSMLNWIFLLGVCDWPFPHQLLS